MFGAVETYVCIYVDICCVSVYVCVCVCVCVCSWVFVGVGAYVCVHVQTTTLKGSILSKSLGEQEVAANRASL